MNGVDLIAVQELLGQKSIVIKKHYSRSIPAYKRRAVESIALTKKVRNKTNGKNP
jgi:site-specific recombinase XerD